jgi:hypothetical protein
MAPINIPDITPGEKAAADSTIAQRWPLPDVFKTNLVFYIFCMISGGCGSLT